MAPPSYPLLVNLAVLSPKPTGISIYAQQVVPHLRSLHPLLLSPQDLPEAAAIAHRTIPANLSPAHGSPGHLRRLLWTQFQLPLLYHQYRSTLIFAPLPEIPLGLGCRSVAMVHDLIPLRFPNPKSALTLYFRQVLPWVLRRSVHLICNSHATAQDVITQFRIPETKITPIPLAYDRAHFRPLNLPRQNYCLYIGRPDPHKNLPRIIQALAQGPGDLELWIVGGHDRRYTPQIQALSDTLGLGQRLKFLDYVPYSDLPQLYSQAIALIFPSLWEGFGLPVLEAMACGTPVITSNCSALPEVAGEAAILVDPYNVGEIAAAIQAIVQDSGLAQQLVNAGLQQAQKFSWTQTGQATAQVLAQLL